MAMSGVSVADECIIQFEHMKLRKSQRCIVFAIKGQKEFVVHNEVLKNEDEEEKQYEEIMKDIIDFAKTHPCYVVWDLHHGRGKNTKKNEGGYLRGMSIVLDSLTPKQKMVYAASIKALKAKLEGLTSTHDLHTTDDLKYESFREIVKPKE